jgi:hypothetical protein
LQRRFLDRAASDVLLLLDACYAANSAEHFPQDIVGNTTFGQRAEMIAASGFETTARGSGPGSFKALTKCLRSMAGSGELFTTASLHLQMVIKLRDLWYRNVSPVATTTPFHGILRSNPDLPSIPLGTFRYDRVIAPSSVGRAMVFKNSILLILMTAILRMTF